MQRRVMQEQDGDRRAVRSAYTIVASGGIGGCAWYKFSAFDGRCS